MPSQQRREHIVSTARQVFTEQGLAGTRIRDLAAAAGVSEAMLYRHFASKDELFKATIDAAVDQAFADSPPHRLEVPEAHTPDSLHDALHDLIKDVARLADDLGPLLVAISVGPDNPARRTLIDAVARWNERAATRAAAVINPMLRRPFEFRRLIELIFGALWFNSILAEHRGLDPDPDILINGIVETMLHGAAAPHLTDA